MPLIFHLKKVPLDKNPKGLILGTPGSGKSFSAKREITNVFLITTDDIIVCDPEGEYFSLVQRLKGQVIKISPTSSQYINPMDININYSEDDSPLALKSDFILSLCELIVGGKEGLTPVEKSIIGRCVTLVYAEYLANPDPAKMPILGDLYDALGRQEEKEAKHIRSALEIYVTGSLSVNNQTQLKHLFKLKIIIGMTTDCLTKQLTDKFNCQLAVFLCIGANAQNISLPLVCLNTHFGGMCLIYP